MIEQTNYRLFLNEFSKLMEKHFNKMDKTCYLNGRDEVVSITLEQQIPLFMDLFWEEMLETDKDNTLKVLVYLTKDQDLMFYNTLQSTSKKIWQNKKLVVSSSYETKPLTPILPSYGPRYDRRSDH